LFLVIDAISKQRSGTQTNIKSIIGLYIISTFIAGFVAVLASFIFPVKLSLVKGVEDLSPPSGILEVFQTLLFNIVDNPVNALINANYIGILAWAILFGLALKQANDTTKTLLSNVSDAITKVVKWIISFAPFGIMGLVFDAIVTSGLSALMEYGKILALLLGCMFFIALIVNPLIVYIYIRQNPYPLVFRCLRESGITAFFTRSSAANIPVNMNLCEKLGLN